MAVREFSWEPMFERDANRVAWVATRNVIREWFAISGSGTRSIVITFSRLVGNGNEGNDGALHRGGPLIVGS